MSDISKTTINLPVDLKKELKKIALKMIEEGMNSRNKSNKPNVFSDED